LPASLIPIRPIGNGEQRCHRGCYHRTRIGIQFCKQAIQIASLVEIKQNIIEGELEGRVRDGACVKIDAEATQYHSYLRLANSRRITLNDGRRKHWDLSIVETSHDAFTGKTVP
jgi:hypothetical protein